MKNKQNNLKFIPLIIPSRTESLTSDLIIGVNGKTKTKFFGK